MELSLDVEAAERRLLAEDPRRLTGELAGRTDPDSRYLLVRAYLVSCRYREAAACAREALAAFPDEPMFEALALSAEAWSHQRDPKAAAARLDQLAASDTRLSRLSLTARQCEALGVSRRGGLHSTGSEAADIYSRAAEAAREVLSSRPWDVSSSINLAVALYRLHDFRGAIAVLDGVRASGAPRWVAYWRNEMIVALGARRIRRASEAYREMCRLDDRTPNPLAASLLGSFKFLLIVGNLVALLAGTFGDLSGVVAGIFLMGLGAVPAVELARWDRRGLARLLGSLLLIAGLTVGLYLSHGRA